MEIEYSKRPKFPTTLIQQNQAETPELNVFIPNSDIPSHLLTSCHIISSS
jgi:hypothetical protein